MLKSAPVGKPNAAPAHKPKASSKVTTKCAPVAVP
ncbi:hypothetical protein PF005_g10780 [Phytophthora fragariae]|uniref:Uncharacterized protein n=1 Tax=Phytophthora fragariae TaxID=53985 RepID=A0A6A3SKS6_9STRA|nr:hypothetical protein PF003_g11417 [Phytophthora fragariae]KAE8938158.1 hypothetical protein PF009_g11937 [Phytophthora fragariae]KAE9011182.1 hypothetical protein PF011_g9477 [Phytophthora fragariae]KAE9113342.1 hypothetical protein PF010_g10110 [Phytophthora fragariae]KAE9119077.1 hypothetical protein PF007_g8677 [Phytophthora fragariae]